MVINVETDLQASISSIKPGFNEMEADKSHIKIHQSLLQET